MPYSETATLVIKCSFCNGSITFLSQTALNNRFVTKSTRMASVFQTTVNAGAFLRRPVTAAAPPTFHCCTLQKSAPALQLYLTTGSRHSWSPSRSNLLVESEINVTPHCKRANDNSIEGISASRSPISLGLQIVRGNLAVAAAT